MFMTTSIFGNPSLKNKNSYTATFTSFSKILLIIAMLLCAQAYAQTPQHISIGESKLVCPFNPDPKSGPCPANDLQVLDLFVGEADKCSTCEPGTKVTAPLTMRINNTTGSIRTSFALFGTLSPGASIKVGDKEVSGNVFICVGPISLTKDINSFVVGSITFICGEEVTLKNNYLAYTAANSTTEDLCTKYSNATSCRDISPKCGVASTITIRTPVTGVASTPMQPCMGSTTGGGSIKVVPTGGVPGYTIDVFKRIGAACPDPTKVPDKTVANGFVQTITVATSGSSATTTEPINEGFYCIYITDSKGCVSQIKWEVKGKECCTPPTITAQPQPQKLCEEGSASFTVAHSGGSPAPTIQWQVSTNGGTSYSNLTEVSPYSNVTSATLTVNPAGLGLNSNLYRAVLTSGNCDAVYSDGALLNVVDMPEESGINTPTQPTCSNPKGSFTVKNVNSDYTYTLTGPDPATSQSNSTGSFSNLASGSYTLTATNGKTSMFAGCTSDGTSVVINEAPGAPKTPVIGVTKHPDCSSAKGEVSISNLDDYGADFEFSSDGITYSNVTTFEFTAGEGIRIYVRRKSDNTCVISAVCGNPKETAMSVKKVQLESIEIIQQTKVLAAPNPYNDKIRFLVTPGETGRGSLELYNMLGQRVKIVFEGQVQKGQVQSVEYVVPGNQRSNLIYVFRVGKEQVSGKLIGLKQ